MKPPFNKPALSLPDQLQHMIDHGMVVSDPEAALRALQYLSYYRLSAYWLPFENAKGAPGPRFRPGTQFETVLALYEFDRRLRGLVLNAMERLEVAIRGSWAYHLAMQSGPHGYLDSALYSDIGRYRDNLRGLQEDIVNSKDIFIRHYYAKYSGPPLPPVWMASEVMTFGRLSRWYKALASAADRQAIADPFELDERIFVPLVHHLVMVRNICAHHSRLWNRQFQVPLALPKKRPVELAASVNRSTDRSLYNTLVLIVYVLKRCAPAAGFSNDLRQLLQTHPTQDLAAMGFPADWDARPIWAL
jgi:abortive infection bacteriophage resistance protein